MVRLLCRSVSGAGDAVFCEDERVNGVIAIMKAYDYQLKRSRKTVRTTKRLRRANLVIEVAGYKDPDVSGLAIAIMHDGYSVTHVPSGRRVIPKNFERLCDAQECLKMLDEEADKLGFSWSMSQDDIAKSPAVADAISDVVKTLAKRVYEEQDCLDMPSGESEEESSRNEHEEDEFDD